MHLALGQVLLANAKSSNTEGPFTAARVQRKHSLLQGPNFDLSCHVISAGVRHVTWDDTACHDNDAGTGDMDMLESCEC